MSWTGAPGRDRLSGSSGDDVLIGGSDDDTLAGGSGSDTYVFSTGSGRDSIFDSSVPASLPGACDVVQFTDVASDELTSIRRRGNDLELTYGSNDKLTVDDQFKNGWADYGIEQILFSDGVTWDRAFISAQAGVNNGGGCGHGWGWGGGHGGGWNCNHSMADIFNQVDLLVSAMAGFNPEPSGQSVILDDHRDNQVPWFLTGSYM